MVTNVIRSTTPSATATRCPGCGSRYTVWVDTGAQQNFLCRTCGSCWHPAVGRTDRVDPLECPGCGLRRICLAACC